MALPKEPRQKMINLMYLVLTCLLALNVSSEILNAFKTIDRSLTTTNNTVNASTQNILASLTALASKAETAEKGTFWLGKAESAASMSKNLFTYITNLKDKILKAADGDPNDPSKAFKEDNLEIVTRIMVKEGEGKKLLQMLTDYKRDVLGIDPAIKTEFEKSLQIDLETPPSSDGSKKDWDVSYFNMVPTVAGLTILSKFQNDVRTTENKVVNFCHNQVGKVEVIFDSYAAVVGQSSNYLMPGQELEITAGVGAFSKKAQPQISIGGSNVAIGEDGTAKFKTAGGGVGSHTIPVSITFFNQNLNKMETIQKSITYMVGQANASIALDKMNVLYIGPDNPVSVAASGGGDDRISVSISGGGGSLRKVGAGKYIAKVTSVTDDCRITVSVDGKVAGASQFRVRTVPNAQAYVGGKASGENMNVAAFKAQAGVGAGIRDFPFELSYAVQGFNLSFDKEDGDVISMANSGAAFSGSVRSALNQLKPGAILTIDGIKVKGPDGRVNSAPSLVYYIK